MGSTEARVDYMGSSILMGVFSNADLQLQDEWKVNLCTVDTSLSEKRCEIMSAEACNRTPLPHAGMCNPLCFHLFPALCIHLTSISMLPTFPLPHFPSLCAPSEIFIHGDLQWDIFQVIISRSTTPDLIKIGMKLQEFFTQQFDTSKRALSTWGPGPYLPPKTPVINPEKGSAELCKHALFLCTAWVEYLMPTAALQVFHTVAMGIDRRMICNYNMLNLYIQLTRKVTKHAIKKSKKCFHLKHWRLFM